MPDTSGAPRRRGLRPDPILDAMTEEQRRQLRKELHEFARNPERVKKSAQAYLALLNSGALDDVH